MRLSEIDSGSVVRVSHDDLSQVVSGQLTPSPGMGQRFGSHVKVRVKTEVNNGFWVQLEHVHGDDPHQKFLCWGMRVYVPFWLVARGTLLYKEPVC